MVDFIHVMQDILSLLLMKTVLFSLDTSILTVHRLDVLHLMNFFVHYYDEITHSIPSPPPKLWNCSITSHFLAPKSSKRRNNWFYPPALFPNHCILNMCEHLVIYSSYPQTKDIYMYYQIFFSNTPAFTTKNKTAKGTINKCESQATITEQTYHEPINFFFNILNES